MVILSHRPKTMLKLPGGVTLKPVLKSISEDLVTFEDNSQESVDEEQILQELDIIQYGDKHEPFQLAGVDPGINEKSENFPIKTPGMTKVTKSRYSYDFPFLTEESDIKLENRWIKYLYKHVINIKHPTMGFIGATVEYTPIPINELQATFFIAYLKKSFTLPSEADMFKDITDRLEYIKTKGWTEKHMHRIRLDQGPYCNELAKIANITPIRQVVHKLYTHVRQDRGNKGVYYKLIDDDNFLIIQL